MRRIVLPLLAVGLLAGCTSGGGASPAPAPNGEAVTTPVGFYGQMAATQLPAAPGGFGAAGPAGVAAVGRDDGRDLPGGLEDSDLLVADPSNGRVLLFKARIRGVPSVVTFNADPLDAPAAVAVTPSLRAVVAVSGGYAVLGRDGATAAPVQTVRGGVHYTGIAVAPGEAAVFLASDLGIDRVSVDAGLRASGAPVPLYVDGAVRGIGARTGGDLFFTRDARLSIIPGAAGPAPGAALDVWSFPAGAEPQGVLENSAFNAVVAVAVPVPAAGNGDRFDELDLSRPGGPVSTLALMASPRGVAIDGIHGAFTWTNESGIMQQIEPSPDLTARVYSILARRECASCHVPGATPPDLDFTSAMAAHDSMFDMPSTCTGGGAMRVMPSDSHMSSLIDKLEGAACGPRMLEGTRPLPSIEVDITRQWIDAGAFESGMSHGGHHH
jgi:hypothetical protein